MDKFKCQTCGKITKPKNGKLSCCGVTEDLQDCIAENERHERASKRSARNLHRRLFGDDIMSDYTGEVDPGTGELEKWYEGIPNS